MHIAAKPTRYECNLQGQQEKIKLFQLPFPAALNLPLERSAQL